MGCYGYVSTRGSGSGQSTRQRVSCRKTQKAKSAAAGTRLSSDRAFAAVSLFGVILDRGGEAQCFLA